MTIRFGIIGCGIIAEDHATALRELNGIAELVVCTDIDIVKTQQFADRWDIIISSSPKEMLKSGLIDAVCICTPPPTHADIAILAAQNGIHVLSEKPLTTTLADADAVLWVVQKQNITLSVVSQRRWFPAAQAVKRVVDGGKLGSRIVLAEVTTENLKGPLDFGRGEWRKTWRGAGGGVLINQCPHSIDLLLWYMGRPTEVFGYCGNFTHPEGEMEDNVVAVIKFASGSLATLRATLTANPVLREHSIVLLGDSGYRISLDIRKFSEGSNDIWTLREPLELPKKLYSNFHAYQIEDFAMALQEKRSPLVTAEDGRRVVAVIDGIYSSVRSGHPIIIQENGRT